MEIRVANLLLKDKNGNTAVVSSLSENDKSLIQSTINDTKQNKDGLAALKGRVDKIVDEQGKPLEAAKATTTALGSVMLASDADVTSGIEGKVVDAKQLAAVKSDLSKVYKYKGSVDTYDALPKEGVQNGDIYNVKQKHGHVPAGANYAAIVDDSGTISWDDLGGSIDTSDFALKSQANTFSAANAFTAAVTVQEPTETNNPATKGYVDTAISGKTVVRYEASQPTDTASVPNDSVTFFPAGDLLTAAQ